MSQGTDSVRTNRAARRREQGMGMERDGEKKKKRETQRCKEAFGEEQLPPEPSLSHFPPNATIHPLPRSGQRAGSEPPTCSRDLSEALGEGYCIHVKR